jgi:aromatic ring-cleaving dioxygenase
VAEAESQGTRDLNRAHSSLYDDRVDLNDQEFGGNFAWVMEKVQAVQVLVHGTLGYNIVNRVHILA